MDILTERKIYIFTSILSQSNEKCEKEQERICERQGKGQRQKQIKEKQGYSENQTQTETNRRINSRTRMSSGKSPLLCKLFLLLKQCQQYIFFPYHHVLGSSPPPTFSHNSSHIWVGKNTI